MDWAEHVQFLYEVLNEIYMFRQLLLNFCGLLLRLTLNFVAIINHTLFFTVFLKQLIEYCRIDDSEEPLLYICCRFFGTVYHFISLIALFLDLLVF